MIAIALAIAAATAAGVASERRWGARAVAAGRWVLQALLYVFVPFVAFVNIARLEVTAGVGIGIALAYVTLAVVGLAAHALATRVLRLPRDAVGALLLAVVLGNTGYLGLPLVAGLLGTDELPAAIAFDTLVSAPMFLVVGFAIGAAFGTEAGDTRGARVRAFLVRNPPLLAVAAGLVAPDALAPDVLVDASHVLVGGLLVLGFFALGVSLASEAEEGALRVPPPLSAPLGVALGLRLVLAPALFAGLAALVVRVPDAYLAQAAAPSGINGLVVAHAYGLDLRIVAGAIAWSTTLVVVVGLVASVVL